MRTTVIFGRREIISVTVLLYGVRDGAEDQEIVARALDAYQIENSKRKFEAELHTVVDSGPTVERLPDRAARVTMVLSKPLPTN